MAKGDIYIHRDHDKGEERVWVEFVQPDGSPILLPIRHDITVPANMISHISEGGVVYAKLTSSA